MLAKSSRETRQLIFNGLGYVPTPEQAEFHFYDLKDPANRIKQLVGGEQAGKAVHIDTPIPTLSGWKTMKEIGAGDYVFADNGKPTEVLWVSPIKFYENTYKLAFDDGTEITADGGHLWATQSEHERKNTNRRKTRGREHHIEPSPLIGGRKFTVRTAEELARETTLPKVRKCANYSIPCSLPVRWTERDLPIPPYILGVWLGDGDNGSGKITTADEFIIKKIQSLGCEVRRVPSALYGYRIEGLTTQLRKLNLFNKYIPEAYLQASIEQRLELLRGLMDTDGYGYDRGCEFYNKNEKLIDDFRELLASLGVRSFKRSKRAKLYGKDCGLAYRVVFNASFPVFSLPRKLKGQNLLPRQSTREHYIRSVEKAEPCLCRCLGVEGELFLITKSYIPTHNSLATAYELLSRALVEGSLYWLCGIDYSIPRKEFKYILEASKELALFDPTGLKLYDDEHKEASLRLASGATILTKSFKDIVRAMTKESPDGIAVCEAAQTSWEDIERCLSRLAASRGWLVLSGTMEGSIGWFSQKFKEWQVLNKEGARSFSIPSWSNIHIYKGGINDPEIVRQRTILPEDKFLERFAAVPCPLTRQVIQEFRNEVHTGNYGFDPTLDVEVAVDPGYAGAYAVLALQSAGEVIYVVDEVYLQGYTTEQMIEICQLKSWWKNVKGGVMDWAGRQHQAMEAPVDVWYKKTGIKLKTTRVNEEEGVYRLRSFLKKNPATDKPQLFVDYRCSGFISECGGGKSPLDSGGIWLRDKHTMKPLNKNNHSCKALIYYLVDRFGYTQAVSRLPVGSIIGYNPFMG